MAQAVELDLGAYVNHTPVEVFGRTRFAPIGELPYYLTLAPYGFFWFELGAPVSSDAEGVPHLRGSWPEVLRSRGLNRALRRWLPGRRWFSAKGEPITAVHVEDAMLIPDAEVGVLVVRLSFSHTADQRYLVPLGRVRHDRGASAYRLRGETVVATIEGDRGEDEHDFLIDAMADEESALALVGMMGSRRRSKGRTLSLQGRPNGRAIRTAVDHVSSGDGHGVTMLDVEQSNSSVIVDGEVIAKLVRRLEPGPSRDATLPAALRSVGFDHVPEVLGELAVDIGSSDGEAVGMVAHRLVSNDSDMWQWTQDELARLVDFVIESGVTGSDEAMLQSLTMAELLGRRTAEMHLALAEVTEEPVRYTLLHQRGLRQAVRSELSETQRMLRRHARRDEAQDASKDGLDAQALLARVEPLRHRKLDATRIHLHGDLHLGQVLWTGIDVAFIDFEGEPTRTLSERSILRNPLVDVAGMVRSFDYAARVATFTAAERSVVPASEQAAVEASSRNWAAAVTDRFWHTYRDLVAGAELIPEQDEDCELLLDTFMISKALYEVRYELSNRPAWVSWPLTALSAMAGSAGQP